MALAVTAEFRRDAWVIGLVSTAHGFSHFFQLVLPPLFPLLKDVFGVSYQALGLLTAVYYATSCLAQPAAGFFVDRFGARHVLLTGLVLAAGATALMGFVPSYLLLFPLVILAGIGNSVFHPADFSILNAQVGGKRLGRAYGLHGIAGNIGWALAPIVSVALAATVGWRTALVSMGAAGLALAAYLALRNELHEQAHTKRAREAERGVGLSASLRMLTALPILMCFAYFALLAISMVGLQAFEIPATMMLYGTSLALATTALTTFLLAGSAGILAGGLIADRTTQHHRVAVTGLLLAAGGVAILATGGVPEWLIVPLFAAVGVCLGATMPSRDLIVKQVTPAGASGKVYGFVYSGLDVGAAAIPLLFGWLLDHGEARWLYLIVAAAMLLSMLTVLNMRPRPAAAISAAAD
jgi:FSR family fosmidomycin resistance protein-like MFS transporter